MMHSIHFLTCNGTMMCLRPGFRRPTQAMKYCFQCNCTMFEQCKLICDIENERMIYCDCTGTGFTGQFCEKNIDDCDESYCLNGGTCIDGVKNYTCACPPGFTGRHCEIVVAPCETETSEPCTTFDKGSYTLYGDATSKCISSPGYPTIWYCRGLQLTWNIFCPPGQRVRVFFVDFVVEDTYDTVRLSNGVCQGFRCPDDILVLYGNADPTYAFINNRRFYFVQKTYDAIQVPYFSTGNALTLYFETSVFGGQGKGFNAEYKCVP
ncbi:protein crumbs-like isoform X2 [Ruditapes philippinarum]|uniref:protein crumbs-like isoform X2 n=1 Tax=Ruditapes philippinarum TaxID=129788 RepID=UPI00295C156A|nr:protein crumbs-like isoform X2 [Ruditapes philippinarum]